MSIPRRKSNNYEVRTRVRECVSQMSVVFLLIARCSTGSISCVESIRTLKTFFRKRNRCRQLCRNTQREAIFNATGPLCTIAMTIQRFSASRGRQSVNRCLQGLQSLSFLTVFFGLAYRATLQAMEKLFPERPALFFDFVLPSRSKHFLLNLWIADSH